eukprot:Phypoly_transcript_17093.p1 GENE.Phypoly_transcript_17093~~Phypoly_transcript_17093.p1  ORF type:complete len:203 (+),score=44.59 Phypoly_transcript_17093:75-683(+)
MSHYKLSYFDIRGLGELSRLLFVITGTSFEDNRIPFEEDRKSWLAVKETFPFLKVPELQVDGVRIPQSKAIERFLAKRFGLFGSSDTETAVIDGFSEQVRDISNAYFAARGDETKLTKFWAEELPNNLHILGKNAGNNGHFVGDKITLPDVQFYYLMSTQFDAKDKVESCLAKHENLKKIIDTVANNDKIKEYVSKRKVTPF